MITMRDRQKRMKILLCLLFLHGTIIPGVIMLFGYVVIKNKDFVFILIGIALLWAFIFYRSSPRKIIKLQQEIDAGK
jgi:1,4-dihydroxy-2-naphthoate octaprenyltransferase